MERVKAKKILIVGLLMIASGWVGLLIGEQKVRLAFKNWKPSILINKESPVDLGRGGKEADLSLFWKVWERVSVLYVDKTALDPKKMIDGAISGMVASLGDPYTVYLPVKQNQETKQDLGGYFEGVGIQLGYKDGNLVVVAPLDGTPAQRAGVKAGDFILRIRDDKKGIDRDTVGITLPEAVNIIRGEKKTVVRLMLSRKDEEKPFEVSLTRETINVKSVTLEYKEQGEKTVAWIKLTRFGDKTQDEWNSAVSEIINHSPKVAGVVLDLRGNPGGYLEGAVYVAGEFLSAGRVVVIQQTGDGSRQEEKIERNGRLLDTKLTIVVNEGSASASEILAGALKDYKRAKVVGVKSFGKGSVQQPEDFGDGSGVHVTIAKWLTPTGAWIDKNGITPDFVVEMPTDGNDDTADPQLDKAIDVLLK
jgi:carboxyl-terminal processing protease